MFLMFRGFRVVTTAMRERVFDESYNIREVLDDVIERVALREKLIQTAKQFSEKKREERFALAIRQFESLMADFLRLYQPILDRIRSHREGLQKEISGLKSSMATVNGMLEVSRGIEALAPKVQQMETDAAELDTNIKEKTKTAEKIDDILNRIRPHISGIPGSLAREPLSDVLGGMPKDLFLDLPETGKEAGASRKSAAKN